MMEQTARRTGNGSALFTTSEAEQQTLRLLRRVPLDQVPHLLDTLSDGQRSSLAATVNKWEVWARPEQSWPGGEWSTWIINAGRGYGKTRTGKEYTHRLGMRGGHRMALIARTHSDLREVMIDGRSGLLSRQLTVPSEIPLYRPSQRRLIWPRPSVKTVAARNQVTVAPEASEATTFTSKEPDDLRGPEFSWAWCDELASWSHLSACWSNLKLALRYEPDVFSPRCIVTTTPRPLQFLRDIMANPDTVVTGGSTYDNIANLPRAFIEEITSLYGDTNLGQQELFAKILDEAEGALWKRAWIEKNRVEMAPDMYRVAVAVDPAVSASEESSETGIVVAGVAKIPGRNGSTQDHFYILDDRSLLGQPHEWAGTAVDAFEDWMADIVVGEVNNGGNLVDVTIQALGRKPNRIPVPFHAVHASRGKDARAEPFSVLASLGKVHHVGKFVDLEDQLCTWEPNKGQKSPDRLDAMVWALTELAQGIQLPTSLAGMGGLDKASIWSQ